MDGFDIPIGEWAKGAIDWIKEYFDGLLDFISFVGSWLFDGLTDVLLAIPVLLLIAIFAFIAWLVRSWQLAVGTIITMVLIVGMGFWESSMQTLSLVLLATIVSVAVAVPLGIWAARNDTVSAFVRPILDFMQTMPALVYLIPAIVFFGIGAVPGMVATVIFSLPAGVRLTELGVRGVDAETVEAGFAFGAKPGQILRGIQLPLAMPTIMAGVNQVILLALSMVVIAGMAGADGLGKDVVTALGTLNVPMGVEAGLSVVFIAIFLDRVTAALGNPRGYRSSLLGVLARSRAEQRKASEEAAASEEASDHAGARAAAS